MQDDPVAVADLPSAPGSEDQTNELDLRQCRQSAAGDTRACGELLKRHEPHIARLLWRFTRNHLQHIELVQEALVQVYLSLPNFRPGKAPFRHWVMRIATRTGYQFWKTQRRRKNFQPLDDLDPPVDAAPDTIDATAAAQGLHDLLAQLPPPDRLVLTLMYFEQCTLREAAQRAGWNLPIVKMRAYRARMRLKKLIEEKNMTEYLTGISHGPA